MPWKIFIIAFAWLTFLCFWIAGIFIYKPPEPRQRDNRWSLFLISVVLITIMAELLAGKYLLSRFDLSSPVDFLAEITGSVLLISGLSFAIWARIRLGRFWSGSIAFIEGQPIVKDGPYVIVRHPIYTGVIMMLWGSFLLIPLGFLLFTAGLGTVFLLWKARLEERMLEKYIEAEYNDYKKHVKGMVLW